MILFSCFIVADSSAPADQNGGLLIQNITQRALIESGLLCATSQARCISYFSIAVIKNMMTSFHELHPHNLLCLPLGTF